jgi:hypothetical protein
MNEFSKMIWMAWEHFFHIAFRLEPIHPKEENHLFYIAKRTYMGRSFKVGAEIVRPFDEVVELHMNNQLLVRYMREDPQLVSLAVRLVREAKKSMPLLADVVRQQRFAKARVIYGVTFIHRGITRLGFSALPMRNIVARRLTRWHLKHVLRLINPDAARILSTHPNDFVPMLVAISKDELIQKYARQPEQKESPVKLNDHCLT